MIAETVGKFSPLMIAEMSGNHNGDIARAIKIIQAAAASGADAIKLQTYTADTMTIDSELDDFMIREGLWQGQSLYQLYQQAHTPWEWHETLFQIGRDLGMLVFSTPFDLSAVDFLESLQAPIYKIASFELTDLPLIKYVASTGKPMIISTGMASFSEIKSAVQVAQSHGCSDLTVLHCVSEYPASVEQCNLATMVDIGKQLNVNIGLSDHTLGTTVSVAAVALGATVIEKHFTLDRSEGGVDSQFSLEPSELAQLCREAKLAHKAIGKVNYQRSNSEIKNRRFRRSIYVVNDIKQGERFTAENIRCIRPGYGLSPASYADVIGKFAKQDCHRGMALAEEVIADE